MIDQLGRSRRGRRGWTRRSRGVDAAGFTLMELLATLSVLLVLAVTASGILTNVRTIGEKRQRASENRAAVLRFADLFRGDVASAQSVTLNDGDWPLRLVTQESVIEYRWNADQKAMTRAIWEGGPDRFGSGDDPVGREVFSLGDRCSPRPEQNGSLVRVVLREQEGPMAAWVVEVVR